MRFCSVCAYYLFLNKGESGLSLLCRHCGYTETMDPQNTADALILETTFAASSSQKKVDSQLNDFTKLDPTLPRLTTIQCPNSDCDTRRAGAKPDILYIKTDAKNLKYQYCCTVCDTQWSS
jgi:DNA-directed RNA polymerase subunit M/transcription elongation factor TFIIS